MPPRTKKKVLPEKILEKDNVDDADAKESESEEGAHEDDEDVAGVVDPTLITSWTPTAASSPRAAALKAAAAIASSPKRAKPAVPAPAPSCPPASSPKTVTAKRKIDVNATAEEPKKEAKKEARVSNPAYIAGGRLNSNMTDRELLFWICGRIHLIEDKTRRNQEQVVDLTGMASKLDEIHESQTAAATAHMAVKVKEECEYAVDSAKVKKFVSAIMTTQQCWANFGNAYYKPLQLKEFGPKGADSGVVTVLVIFFCVILMCSDFFPCRF